jgi:hypothetical protein
MEDSTNISINGLYIERIISMSLNSLPYGVLPIAPIIVVLSVPRSEVGPGAKLRRGPAVLVYDSRAVG